MGNLVESLCGVAVWNVYVVWPYGEFMWCSLAESLYGVALWSVYVV